MKGGRSRVVVVGAGVAGLEACLALRHFAGDGFHVTLVAPSRYFAYRPIGVRDPLAVNARARVPVARIARVAGAELRTDQLAAIDPKARRVRTAAGYELPYDALVVCVGARASAVPARAEPFDEEHTAGCRVLMQSVREGRVPSLVFVEPSAPARAFDLYDLVIETAATLRRDQTVAELTVVTSEPSPLAIIGPTAAGLLRGTLGGHGIRVVESAHVRSIGRGEIELAPLGRRILAERVIAAPRLTGPRLDHLPSGRDGFLPVDPYGRVPESDGVYAAGDCTPFPVRHPSLAAQQADAAAASVAADAGLPLVAEPFKPVLRGMLPSRLRWYAEAPLSGGQGEATSLSALPLWSSPARFHARFLAPHLGSGGTPDDGRESLRLRTRSAAPGSSPPARHR